MKVPGGPDEGREAHTDTWLVELLTTLRSLACLLMLAVGFELTFYPLFPPFRVVRQLPSHSSTLLSFSWARSTSVEPPFARWTPGICEICTWASMKSETPCLFVCCVIIGYCMTHSVCWQNRWKMSTCICSLQQQQLQCGRRCVMREIHQIT